MITKTQAKRLLKLADYLAEEVPRKRFNMTTWFTVNSEERPKRAEFTCSTSACALGHAASMKAFKDLGLRLEMENNKYRARDSENCCFVSVYDAHPVIRPTKKNGHYSNHDNVIGFLFGEESKFLFMGRLRRRVTPRMKAREIHRFVHKQYPNLCH